MRIDQYKSEVKRHETALVIRMIASISSMFLFLGIAAAIRVYDVVLAEMLAPILVFAFGFPIMVYGFWRADHTYQKFPKLICPHCEGSIARPKAVVIATGNCPNCGRNIVVDRTIGT